MNVPGNYCLFMTNFLWWFPVWHDYYWYLPAYLMHSDNTTLYSTKHADIYSYTPHPHHILLSFYIFVFVINSKFNHFWTYLLLFFLFCCEFCHTCGHSCINMSVHYFLPFTQKTWVFSTSYVYLFIIYWSVAIMSHFTLAIIRNIFAFVSLAQDTLHKNEWRAPAVALLLLAPKLLQNRQEGKEREKNQTRERRERGEVCGLDEGREQC